MHGNRWELPEYHERAKALYVVMRDAFGGYGMPRDPK
jgi:hypothetical protein